MMQLHFLSLSQFWERCLCSTSLNACLTNSGEVINERDRCPQCKGSKVTQDKKVLEVHVEKGMKNDQRIVFEGEADEAVR